MSGADWPAPWVRAKLAYEPRDLSLFEAALTHRSASGRNNERLEFLGDAVLNLVVAEHLYRANPDCTEGDLSRLRARVVSSEPLAEVAASIGIGEALHLGSGELKAGGFRRKSILADALEAIVGALFLDGGLDVARSVVETLFQERIAALPPPDALKDAKTRLQEYLQSRGYPLPRYTVEKVEGEQHAQLFWVVCEVQGIGGRNGPKIPATAQGSGSSRRRAEQEAAERILVEITETTGDKVP
jgi:ribonuclease III